MFFCKKISFYHFDASHCTKLSKDKVKPVLKRQFQRSFQTSLSLNDFWHNPLLRYYINLLQLFRCCQIFAKSHLTAQRNIETNKKRTLAFVVCSSRFICFVSTLNSIIFRQNEQLIQFFGCRHFGFGFEIAFCSGK